MNIVHDSSNRGVGLLYRLSRTNYIYYILVFVFFISSLSHYRHARNHQYANGISPPCWTGLA